MASIGDLYFTFRGDGARLQADAKTQGAKAGSTLGSSMTAGLKKSFSGEQLGKGLVQGLGLAGALSGFALVSRAASAFTDVIGDSIAAARADEVSIQKLNTSLAASIPNWDGNTKAIEKTLAARIKLGFSDDDQREGLATLVSATHDYTKGLDLERGAMDLARKRNIDLATASDAVAKAYAGNTKGLKNLIPGLKIGATTTETIANAFAAVSGQAEDYAKTNDGKVVVAQVRVNEAMEKLGYVLLPIVAEAATKAADVVDNIVSSFDDLNQTLKDVTGSKSPLDDLGTGLDALIGTMAHGGNTALWLAEKQHDLAVANQKAADSADDVRESNVIAGVSVDKLAGKTEDLATTSVDKTRIVENAFRGLASSLAASAQAAIDGFFGPIEAEQDRYNARLALQDAEETLRNAKTPREREEAKQRIVAALKDEGEAVTKLGDDGKLTGSKLDTFTNDAKTAFKTMGQKVPPDIKKITDPLKTLVGYDGKTIDITVAIKSKVIGGVVQDFGSLTKGPAHAAGGYQARDQVYRQNENGFEATVPWNAYIMGAARTKQYMRDAMSGSSGGSAGDTNINLTVPAAPTALKPSDIVRELRIRARDGSLDVRRALR